jgi:Na+:H+ antiporter, NhaC family
LRSFLRSHFHFIAFLLLLPLTVLCFAVKKWPVIRGMLLSAIFAVLGAAKNLSRTTEDSGTVVVPLIPWSMAGVYMAGALGVPVTAYAPWAFMCYLGCIFALIYGFTGFAIAPIKRDDETLPGS